jgi:hypothetical protein
LLRISTQSKGPRADRSACGWLLRIPRQSKGPRADRSACGWLLGIPTQSKGPRADRSPCRWLLRIPTQSKGPRKGPLGLGAVTVRKAGSDRAVARSGHPSPETVGASSYGARVDSEPTEERPT